MYSLSNSDFAKAVRLLKDFCSTKGETRRESEDRRQAALLVRKMEQRKKMPR